MSQEQPQPQQQPLQELTLNSNQLRAFEALLSESVPRKWGDIVINFLSSVASENMKAQDAPKNLSAVDSVEKVD